MKAQLNKKEFGQELSRMSQTELKEEWGAVKNYKKSPFNREDTDEARKMIKAWMN